MRLVQAIESISKQLAFSPEIERLDQVKKKERIIVGGMGGSHLAADILAMSSSLDIRTHRDYGIPGRDDDTLYIASSYSGNTEEACSFAEKVIEYELPLICISSGGKLSTFAREHDVPLVVLPGLPHDTLPPRTAVGYALAGLTHVLEELGYDVPTLPQNIDPHASEERGKEIARRMRESIPLIYASARNEGLAYLWKITMNESAKLPAFYNVVPELNHNEIEGFKAHAEKFFLVLLDDENDTDRIRERMKKTEEVYERQGMSTATLLLSGDNRIRYVIESIILAEWVAHYSSDMRDVDPLQTPLIDTFKEKLS